MNSSAEKRFIRASKLTIVFLFLVILAGGVVRSTGSGMGCPDWPKCFNRVIPPTDVSQLPAGYEKLYIEGRMKKNVRFANIVEAFGFPEKANQIRHDESIFVHEEFNAAKTWTEYLNRLVGVIVGFCLLFTAIFSLKYYKVKPSITVWSVLNVFVVVIQAWLGSIVVSTNLMPWIITVHMLLALVIVSISIYSLHLAKVLIENDDRVVDGIPIWLRWFCLFNLVILMVQIVLGTGVREHVDLLDSQGTERSQWILLLGQYYEYHRYVGYLTLVLVLGLYLMVKRYYVNHTGERKYMIIVLCLAVAQMLSGIILARFALPEYIQTTHLVVASLFFGGLFYLMLLLDKAKYDTSITR